MQVRYFNCDCWDADHDIRFVFDKPEKINFKNPDGTVEEIDNWADIYLEARLNDRNNIFKRILIAIKYVIGMKTGVAHSYGITICQERFNELISFLTEIKEYVEQR